MPSSDSGSADTFLWLVILATIVAGLVAYGHANWGWNFLGH